MNATEPALGETRNHGTRRAACTDDDRDPAVCRPVRRAGLIQIGQKPRNIRVVPEEAPIILQPKGIHGAQPRRTRARMVDARERRLLVRDRDIATEISTLGKVAQEVRKILRGHVDALVASFEPMLSEPVAMNQR